MYAWGYWLWNLIPIQTLSYHLSIVPHASFFFASHLFQKIGYKSFSNFSSTKIYGSVVISGKIFPTPYILAIFPRIHDTRFFCLSFLPPPSFLPSFLYPSSRFFCLSLFPLPSFLSSFLYPSSHFPSEFCLAAFKFFSLFFSFSPRALNLDTRYLDLTIKQG